MIFTSLSPNTERDDVFLALRMLFSPWHWRNQGYIDALEASFKNYLPANYAIAFQSGRNALYALLKALRVGPHDEVLIQAYTCVAVPEPILWTGAKPVYVDVQADFTMDPVSLRKKITSRSKVLIIQHTFGIPAKIKELVMIARQYNITVIEDCAHALGAQYHGQKVGTFGDAAFFSFGRDKVISSVFGGMAVIKTLDLAKKVRTVEQTYRQPSDFYIIQQLLHPIILSIAKKTYNSFAFGKIILEISKRLHITSRAVEHSEYSGGKPSFFATKMPPAMAILALNQFKKLERYNAHRIKIAGLYTERLLHNKKLLLPTYDKDTEPVVLRYTVLAEFPKKLIKKAREEGIELGDWYTNSIAPKKVNYEKILYDSALYPNAEKLAEHSINLPTHIAITEKDVKKITDFLTLNA